jgi:outer membrane protein assembly factor BamB
LVQTEPGTILLVEGTAQQSKVLGKLKALDSKTWTNLCLAGKWLVARNDREAVCYELPVK